MLQQFSTMRSLMILNNESYATMESNNDPQSTDQSVEKALLFLFKLKTKPLNG